MNMGLKYLPVFKIVSLMFPGGKECNCMVVPTIDNGLRVIKPDVGNRVWEVYIQDEDRNTLVFVERFDPDHLLPQIDWDKDVEKDSESLWFECYSQDMSSHKEAI